MTEEWRTAIYDGEIYEGLYKVSNLGRILSLNYRNTGKPGLMTPVEIPNGYFQVKLWKNKEYKKCYLHRLIAETFLPNPEGKPCVNHKIEGNKGKTMNFVFFNEDGSVDEERTSIEWATYEENNKYGTRTERAAKAISKANKGKPAHNKGVPMSEEQKKKLSEAAKRRFMLKKMQPDGCIPLW